MRVTITFHEHDDVTDESRDRIVGTCLVTDEVDTAIWRRLRESGRHQLTFKSSRSIQFVLENFQDEGFEADEFREIKFSFL